LLFDGAIFLRVIHPRADAGPNRPLIKVIDSFAMRAAASRRWRATLKLEENP